MKKKKYIPNIPESDKNNFHQFQPLLYQVATAGLEPSAISFPLRKILQRECNVHFRMADILEISAPSKEIRTNIGYLKYDYLALAMGTNPNFFGHASIENNTLPMKSAADAILIRNTILENLARNLRKMRAGGQTREFEYRDKGSLATIGRNLAVADLPYFKLKGFLAWALWSFVHLFAIVGVKNKVFIFLDWSWNYFTYDPSLRLLIRHKPAMVKKQDTDRHIEIPRINEISPI